MTMTSFDKVWSRILSYQGEVFKTISKLPFTYRVDSEGLITSRNTWHLSKGNFEKAFHLGKGKSLSELSDAGMVGHSYVWAVLNDSRICGW